ncbi:hypothetical protein [Azospirillum rugosum]|uniref:Uncharacterized protein n=1 Tax=Azospirillum rugosum TaxID=416170 RepID=A0ABS4SEN7_9PROT|nr:hypothetical protein [Azospirillum rugosum]MBP2291051.1 hypothetical protein [Azospirillum rugosum]MDQ0524885.1 hypothetical protein [Azospirillum rugosum]
MANLIILWNIASDSGTLSSGSWLSGNGLKLDNLKTQDITEVARTTDTAPASTRLRIDMGHLQPLSAFAWINHNAPDLATYDLIYSNAADGSAPVYSATGLRFWEPTVVWGSRPFGAFPLTLVDKASYPGTPIAFHLAPGQYYGRYVFANAKIPDGPSSYFQAGRVMAGLAFQPQRGMALGAAIRPVDPSDKRRTQGGARLVRKLPKYTTWKITLPFQTEAEALGVYFDLMHKLGISGEMLIVWDHEKPAPIRARLTLYCALSDTSEITVQPAFDHAGATYWTVTLDVEELI